MSRARGTQRVEGVPPWRALPGPTATSKLARAALTTTVALVALATLAAPTAAAVEWTRPIPGLTPAPALTQPQPLQHAVLLAPIGPLVGLVGNAVGLGTGVVALRGHRRVSPRVAATLALSYTQLRFLYRYRVLGVKFGPRLALSRPVGPSYDLAGWYVLPMGLLGWGWVHNHNGTALASSPVVGGGVEAGYLWRWTHVVIELGVGVAYSALIGTAQPRPTETQSSLKPLLNFGVGYGW